MTPMKRIAGLLAALLLAGCTAVNNQVTLAEYAAPTGQRNLPAIAIYSKQPSPEQLGQCKHAYTGDRYCDPRAFDVDRFRAVITASGLFESVVKGADAAPTEFQLAVSVSTVQTASLENTAQALLAGATLLLAPVSQDAVINAEVQLYWQGLPIRQFTYAIPFQFRTALSSLRQDTAADIARSVASHVLRDLQSGEAFSAEALTKALQSDDYHHNLQVPAILRGYFHDWTNVNNHPFRGAQAHYYHEERGSDVADVFIYPIRNDDWSDSAAILSRETASVRREIEQVSREAGLTRVQLQEPTRLHWNIAGTSPAVTFFEGSYQDPYGNVYMTRTYLATMGDKFIKVRNKALLNDHNRANTDAFVQSLLTTLKVPDESPFMARIRKQWRDRGEL